MLFRSLLGQSPKPAQYGGILHDDHDDDTVLPNPTPVSEPSDLPTPANAVPATPSLIHALKRVSEAQRAAKAGANEFVPRGSGEEERKEGWESWWGDVVERAERK